MTVWREIKEYLNGEDFKKQVVRSYKQHEVLAEGGLRALVVFLIQRKLRQIDGAAELNYRVAGEGSLPDHRVRPDILIWGKRDPRIWIELKDTRVFVRSSAESDWKKLQDYCPQFPSIRAGFLIYVARTRKREFPVTVKRTRKTMKLWPVPIVLEDYFKDGFELWDAEYKRRAYYRAKGPKDITV
jgi:hypothetical protein